jgi:hypothetical protein
MSKGIDISESLAQKLFILQHELRYVFFFSWYAYLFAIRHKETLNEGAEILKKALAVYSKIFHPK